MKTWIARLVVILSLMVVASPALAAPERFDLTTSFSDGATATGYYVHDSDTGEFSQIHVTVQGGGWPTATYVNINHSSTFGIWLVAYTAAGNGVGERVITIKTATSGSTRQFQIYEGYCSSDCQYFQDSPERDTFGTAYLHTPAIPTLTEWAMILMGISLAGAAALILQKRRRTS